MSTDRVDTTPTAPASPATSATDRGRVAEARVAEARVAEPGGRTPHTAQPASAAAAGESNAGAGPRPHARGGADLRIEDAELAAQSRARLAAEALVRGARRWHRRGGRVVDWAVGEWSPPVVWSQRPASLAELVGYARHGSWTAAAGAWRTAGLWWMALVAVPMSTVAYYAAWILQRPSRAAVCAVLYVAVSHTGIGQAVLPWPGWLP